MNYVVNKTHRLSKCIEKREETQYTELEVEK